MCLGLVAFIIVVLTNLVALVLDLYLYYTGMTTITDRIPNTPSLAFLIIAWQAVGMLGLAYHFWGAQ